MKGLIIMITETFYYLKILERFWELNGVEIKPRNLLVTFSNREEAAQFKKDFPKWHVNIQNPYKHSALEKVKT